MVESAFNPNASALQCDISVHPCPRCKRRGIPCVGLGQRRFKFVSDDQTSSQTTSPSPPRQTTTPETKQDLSFVLDFNTLAVSRSPSNETSYLAHAFAERIKPAVGIKYNLAWTYGDYLNFIPARLGTNEALDSATDTFLTAVTTFTDPFGSQNSPVVLEKYGRTLASLRKCLDDPVKAKAPETLAAILFLWNCQVSLLVPSLIRGMFCIDLSSTQFVWQRDGAITTHADGIAQIVRLRDKPTNTKDPFELNLLLALRAVVVSHWNLPQYLMSTLADFDATHPAL